MAVRCERIFVGEEDLRPAQRRGLLGEQGEGVGGKDLAGLDEGDVLGGGSGQCRGKGGACPDEPVWNTEGAAIERFQRGGERRIGC